MGLALISSVAIPRIDEYVTLGIATNKQEIQSSPKPFLSRPPTSPMYVPRQNKIRALAKMLLIILHCYNTILQPGRNTFITQNHPLNSRGATSRPTHRQYTAHPSWDTSPRVVQFLPSLSSTAPRLLHSDFPECALHFCRERAVSTSSKKSRKCWGEMEVGRILTRIQEAG